MIQTQQTEIVKSFYWVKRWEVRETDWWLRALGTLAEDLGLLASTHMVAHNDGMAHVCCTDMYAHKIKELSF